MKTTSKNQRSGPKAVAKKRYCAEGHELERVKYVPVFGRGQMFWRCACGLSK